MMMRRFAAGLAAAAFVAACAHLRHAGRADAECRPVGDAPLPASASTALMAGEFSFTMVATGGAQAGKSVTGRLSLVPQDSALVAVERASNPLRGTVDVALEEVGAVRMGTLDATAHDAPGVAVIEQRSPSGNPTVVVRLGSASTARGPSPFDAGHTTLFVRRIAADGFAGGWSSSAGSVYPMREAQGYFCAVRSPLQ